ncbi:MAG: tryptophan--tRNA ligase [Candidatus Blackburnbacteria bacterium]|nr:tryptophan--tRNA ligase [Candidatus Blackburnbacteria bacterium]
MAKRVLSGIRANGRLHLGNYLGAVKGMLALQDDPSYETFYMVADLHSINVPYDPKKFQAAVRDVILDYLAAGLDPEKSTIFIQSQVPEHVELSYLFSTVITVARMQHLPTFKEKVKSYPENVNMALLYYPVLMAADILAYRASLVPVGIDQEPHLEVAREVAQKMNDRYGLKLPEPQRFATAGEYVPSLTGEGKMAKSVEGSAILLTDDLETIKERLARVPTDSGTGESVPMEGGVTNLLKLVELFISASRKKELEGLYVGEGIRYGEVKAELAEAIFAELAPMQEKRRELENNPEKVDRIILEGVQKARKVTSQTVSQVKKAMGLV